MNIALFQYGIENIEGGGGAERFFADFFDEYNSSADSKNKLYYILDKNSISNLKGVGKLNSGKKIIQFKIFSNRFKNFLESAQLIALIILYDIRVIHIPLYNQTYIPLLRAVDRMPSFFRPRIVINIVNCFVSQVLSNPSHKDFGAFTKRYLPLFHEIKADGYFCWNQSFVDYVSGGGILKHHPKKIKAIESRFANETHYMPSYPKKNLIVFASRLEEQKHPEWYVEAAVILKNKYYNEIKNWQIILFGDGHLEGTLRETAEKNAITDIFSMKIEADTSAYFNHSKIYVSCQDYDNFPSLSMAEAMLSGNAIIARNVGQTNLFLKDKENGLLINPDSAEGLAETILKLITGPESQLEEMGKRSIELMKNVHNVPNFIKQIDAFWNEI